MRPFVLSYFRLVALTRAIVWAQRSLPWLRYGRKTGLPAIDISAKLGV